MPSATMARRRAVRPPGPRPHSKTVTLRLDGERSRSRCAQSSPEMPAPMTPTRIIKKLSGHTPRGRHTRGVMTASSFCTRLPVTVLTCIEASTLLACHHASRVGCPLPWHANLSSVRSDKGVGWAVRNFMYSRYNCEQDVDTKADTHTAAPTDVGSRTCKEIAPSSTVVYA